MQSSSRGAFENNSLYDFSFGGGEEANRVYCVLQGFRKQRIGTRATES